MIVIEALPEDSPPFGSVADPLVLDWDLRAKTRQRCRTAAGRDLGIKLPTGTRLAPGATLLVGDGFHVVVVAAEEDVWVVACPGRSDLARVAFELGNRHLPIEIGSHEIAVRHDPTLESAWTKLGVKARRLTRPFLAGAAPVAHAWDPPARIVRSA